MVTLRKIWGRSVFFDLQEVMHELKARSWEYSIRADSSLILAIDSMKCLLSVCKIEILQRLIVVGQIWDVFLEVGNKHITNRNTISCQALSPSSGVWGCLFSP